MVPFFIQTPQWRLLTFITLIILIYWVIGVISRSGLL